MCRASRDSSSDTRFLRLVKFTAGSGISHCDDSDAHRDIYLDALEAASSGDFTPFQELLTEAIAESLRRAISFFS
jgi:hypothetical protein